VTLSQPHSAHKTESSNKPKVLHICSDLANQHIYTQLVSHLAKKGISQVIYAPVRSVVEAKWTTPELKYIEHYLRHILHPYHRLLFRTKVRAVYKDICRVVNLTTIGVVHAHFLYSDGAVALELKKYHGIPYIVAVRNTDINFFMRYRPDLCLLRDKILREACQVVFISPAYRTVMSNCISESLNEIVKQKTIFIPNGISSDWLKVRFDSVKQCEKQSDCPLRILYVGNFSRNKNVPGLIHAVALFSKKRATHLTLVGGDGNDDAIVRNMLISDKYEFTEYVGRVTNMAHLREIYQNHDLFAMPSFKETFGVVYIEALSQGLPIIHSRNQGVDGYFAEGTVSEAVDPADPVDIAQKIAILAERCFSIRQECVDQARRFDWSRIASTYKELYLSILPRNPEVS
jgi:L-malate glycosyltransferase